ncbi:type II toxin-antitoxin system RelE/ParE family toxin [Epilithonimonas sp. UC225_85]|uniref:type II toxin-antitoxin system RelE/ParE family toxin n=1 Tax=Epilithonimonas sp. UC225_85 TaxID=3350167 RepID=UPI0036D21F0F
MEYKIEVSKLATQNIDEAIEYYKKVSSSSAKNLKKRIFEGYKILKLNPFFATKYNNVRALPLKKFPYILFFDIDEENKIVSILSVFCTHQNPEKYP